MLLTTLAIQNARAQAKPHKLADGDGLYLLVGPHGKKLWRFRYRFAGRENMLALGSFPTVSLASARSKREAARKLIADGIGPANQRKQDKLTAARNTFAAIVEEHLKTLEGSGAAASTISKNRWLLQELAAPLSRRPIAEITLAEILVILKRIELSGRRETARRLRGALAPPAVVHRAAITDEPKLGALMVSIDEHDGWPTVRAALQLVALTMTRPGEVRLMRRSEIVWPKAMWRIPDERMKMRQPHEVPLSRQALAILREIWPLSEGGGLVLPSVRSPVKPLSENAITSALRRMGYRKDEMCPHGFRSAASTILNERGYDRDVIEAALAHQDEDQIRAAYNRSKCMPQRTKLMQDWASRREAPHIA
jgi:integrase